MSEENKKQNQLKAEAPKTEAPKAEAKTEAPKEEAKKVEAKTEAPKEEAPKAEAKTEAPKEEAKTEVSKESKSDEKSISLQGLFAFKMAMTSLYDEKGFMVPVTVLNYKPWNVSQIKTKAKEGYSAIQLACSPQKNKRSSRALIKHLTPAGFKEGARYVKEVRQELPEGIKVGQVVTIESLKKGDRVKITSRSKGRGFAGVMKRWGFSGGRASHGAKNHRQIGSIGQHTEPSRVFPGRKMPGHFGFRNTSYNVEVYDVLLEEQMILIRGSIPGARNTLVSLVKRDSAHA